MKLLTVSQSDLSEDSLKEIVDKLRKGAVVAHPTETVYGLAVNIYNSAAVSRLNKIKNRKENKALSVIVRDVAMIESLVGEISDFARRVLDEVFPGPVTVILPIKKKLNIAYFSERDSIGFRIPKHYLCQAILNEIDFPITTTSANKSGMKNPQLAMEVLAHFGDTIDLLVDGGKTSNDVPSTILDLRKDELRVLREGAYDITELNEKLSNG